MRATGGKCEQFVALSHQKETLVPEPAVNAIGGVSAGRSGIDDLFAMAGSRGCALVGCFAAGKHGGSPCQELPAAPGGVPGRIHQYSNTRLVITPQWRSCRALVS